MLDMPDKQVAVESLENLRSQEMEVKLYYLVLTKMGEKVTFVHDFDQRSQRKFCSLALTCVIEPKRRQIID